MDDQRDLQEAIIRSLLGDRPRREYSPYGTGQGQIEDRYRRMGPMRRGFAGAQNMINSVPLVRSIPGIDTALAPDFDQETARLARPTLSAVERTLGHSTPYVVAGSGIPALFSSLPRTALSSMALEGADAAIAGENVPQAMGHAALSAIPGPILGKLVTPRTPQEIFNAQWQRALEHANNVRAGMRDIGASSFPGTWSPQAQRLLGRTLPPDQRMAMRDTFNSGVRQIPPPARNAYLENQLLTPQQQAILSALGSGYTQELIGDK